MKIAEVPKTEDGLMGCIFPPFRIIVLSVLLVFLVY